jgi:hypothetical protein
MLPKIPPAGVHIGVSSDPASPNAVEAARLTPVTPLELRPDASARQSRGTRECLRLRESDGTAPLPDPKRRKFASDDIHRFTPRRFVIEHIEEDASRPVIASVSRGNLQLDLSTSPSSELLRDGKHLADMPTHLALPLWLLMRHAGKVVTFAKFQAAMGPTSFPKLDEYIAQLCAGAQRFGLDFNIVKDARGYCLVPARRQPSVVPPSQPRPIP